MSKISEESLKIIKKKVQNLSQTAEFEVLKEFANMRYIASPHYYSDYDVKKQEEIVRQLDFSALKAWTDYKIRDKETYLFVNFIGDVKFPIKYDKRVLVGLTPTSTVDNESMPYIFNKIQSIGVFSIFFPWKVKKSSDEELFVNPFPVCRNIVFFDSTGENEDKKKEVKKNNEDLFDYCTQVLNGYYKEKNERYNDDSFTILIPTLIFGNQVQFVTGHPDDFQNDQLIYPDALFYLFQSHQNFWQNLLQESRSHEPSYITPILITSLKNMNKVIEKLERNLVKSFEDYINSLE